VRLVKDIWHDIRHGENIDLYLTVIAAIVVSILGLLNVTNTDLIISLTLAVLALLAFASLQSRQQIAKILESQKQKRFVFSERSPISIERLRRAKSIAHNGITLVGTSNTLLGVFSDCIAKGGNVRLIVVASDDISMEVAAQRFVKHQDAERLRREALHALDNFSSILAQYPKDFEVRTLKAMPPFSLWILDADTSHAEIWLGLYPFRDQPEPWIQIFPHTDREMFEFLVRQFNLMWEASETWGA